MGKRYVWFVLTSGGATYDQGLYLVLLNHKITGWRQISVGDMGNVTYSITMEEENLPRVRNFLINEGNKKLHGIVQSGVLENGNLLGWPKDGNLPSALSEMAPLHSLEPKKTKFAKAVESLKKRFGHGVIKNP
jgi:hypothetical protein